MSGPSMAPTIQDLVNHAEDVLKSMMAAGISLGSDLFVHLRDGLVVLPFKDSDETKEILLKRLAMGIVMKARKSGAFLGASSLSEAWMSTGGKHIGSLYRVMKPSQDPDRIETVILQVWGPDGKLAMRVYELVRNGTNKSLGRLMMTNDGFEVRTWLDPAFRSA